MEFLGDLTNGTLASWAGQWAGGMVYDSLLANWLTPTKDTGATMAALEADARGAFVDGMTFALFPVIRNATKGIGLKSAY